MTYTQYLSELNRLRDVLKDAINRGDYHLEFDVIELIERLDETFEGDEE